MVCWPDRIGLAVNVEDKTANRHRRISAVFDQLVPSPVAQLGDIHAERREQILGVAWRQVPVFECSTQSLRHRFALDMAEKAGLKRVKMGKFLVRLERRMIGDVVSGADEFIEGQNGGAMLRFDQYGCDREILVPVTFAGP